MPDTSQTLRSALLVDFDNVFISLKNIDPEAAKAFANEPQLWLDAIATGSLFGGEDHPEGTPEPVQRRILVRRCYANPSLMRYFRGAFMRAGFQIIDCPSLTGRGKNSADIFMVIEALDLIGHETRFDEFIVLSSDADFSPLLTRLRLHDRRSVIYSNPVTASAYRALADDMVGEENLIALLADRTETVDPKPAPARPASNSRREPRAQAERPRRPPVRPAPGPPSSSLPEEIAPLARRVAHVTGAPVLSPEAYAALFRALAAEVDERGFALSRTVSGVVARLASDGLEVRPQAVAYVIKGLSLIGCTLEAGVDPKDYAKAMRRQLLYLAATRNLDLSADDRLMIGAWIIGGLRSVGTAEIVDDQIGPSDADFAASIAADADPEEADEGDAAPGDPIAETRSDPETPRRATDINGLLERIRGKSDRQ